MNETQMFYILKKILTEQSMNSIKNVLVIDSPDGYELFGEFSIRKDSSGYNVEKFNTDVYKHFYNLKNAVIWTTLYKRNMIPAAKRVSELDSSLESITTEIKTYTNLSSKAKDLEYKSVYVAKLVQARCKKALILKEIEDFETSVKHWQYSKYKQITA